MFAVRYSTKKLENLLKDHFPDEDYPAMNRISESPVVAFTSFDLDNNKMIMFSNTSQSNPGETDEDVTVAQALRATSAAPTYFKAVEINGRHYVDGGLGANCPAVMALRFANDHFNRDVSLASDEHDEMPRMRNCELLVSLGTGMNKPGKKPREKGGCLASLLGWGIKLREMITDSESIYEEARKDLKRQNIHAYHERLNPPVDTDIGTIGLDSTETEKMVNTTDNWLNDPQTESDLWRIVHKLIAKNYYVDVNTRNVRTEKRKYAIISQMLRDGSHQRVIRQRAPLFKIDKFHFEAKATDHVKKIEIIKDEKNNCLKLCITPAWHVKDKEDVQVSVYFTPDTSKPEERYHIGGSPFTFTLYNPFRGIYQHQKGKKLYELSLRQKKIAQMLIVEPGSLSQDMISELSKEFTDSYELLCFGVDGLKIPARQIQSHLHNQQNEVCAATHSSLENWSKSKSNKDEAFDHLVRALYTVGKEDLARSKLGAKFKFPEDMLLVEPRTLSEPQRMILELSLHFTDTSELIRLGMNGLQEPDQHNIESCFKEIKRDVRTSTYEYIKDWITKQTDKDKAFIDLVKALYVVNKEELARSVLGAEFRLPDDNSDNIEGEEQRFDLMILKLAEQLDLVEDIKRLGIYGLGVPEYEVIQCFTDEPSNNEAAHTLLHEWKKTNESEEAAITELRKALRKVGRSDWAEWILGTSAEIEEEISEDEDTEASEDEEEQRQEPRELTDRMLYNMASRFTTEEDIYYFGTEGLQLPEHVIRSCLARSKSSITFAAFDVMRQWLKNQENQIHALKALKLAVMETTLLDNDTFNKLIFGYS